MKIQYLALFAEAVLLVVVVGWRSIHYPLATVLCGPCRMERTS